MKVLLLGGTGTLSFAVMTLALSKGMEITVFNRGNNNSLLPSSVKKLVGNFYDKVSIEDSMRGKTFDVVVDFLSRKPEDIRRVFKIFEDKCIQYIFISSACVYRRDNNDFPLKEYSPKPNINWKYNIEKYESEKTLISLCKQGKCYYTIIRPYITYDDNRIPFGIAPIYKYHRTIIERIRSGKPMFIWEKGDVLTTVTHVADFSKGVVGLFMNTKAFNEDFHITSGYIYKVKDILLELCKQLNTSTNIVNCEINDICKIMPNYSEMLVGDRALPAIFDNSKILNAVKDLNFSVSLSDGIKQILNNYELQNCYNYDYIYDAQVDRLLGIYGIKTSYIKYPNDKRSHRLLYFIYKNFSFKVASKITKFLKIR